MSAPQIPPLFSGLIDDAALFPPGNAPMAEAVPAHREHRAAWYAAAVGPFLCTDTRLPELQRALPDDGRPLELGLIVTGGAGAIEPAVTWVRRDERLRLAGVEIALRDEPDPGRNVRRIGHAADAAGLVDDDIAVGIEIRPGTGMTDALDVVAELGARAKLRTGPARSDAVDRDGPNAAPSSIPAEPAVAAFILACLDREVPFKCTAGLHHAVRHTADDGGEEHGYLNILLATRAGLDGGGAPDLVRTLAERDRMKVADTIREVDEARSVSTRRWFTSYGSCSVTEPLADAESLHLLRRPL